MTCPQCGSDLVTIWPYDFGRDLSTGYSDSGVRYRCGACGAEDEVDE